jgi:hypothetical protein
MESENYFPKIAISDKRITFNQEAIESMNLDSPGSKVVIIEVTNPDKDKNNKEILVVKVNGSSFDDPESIKEILSDPENSVIDKNLVKIVNLVRDGDNEIVEAYVDTPKETLDVLREVMGDKDEFKLLPCNSDTELGKEFKEAFDIQEIYYRLAYLSDKRMSVGKEKVAKASMEERIGVSVSDKTNAPKVEEVTDVDFMEIRVADPFTGGGVERI